MKDIIIINSNINKAYDKEGLLTRLLDKTKIKRYEVKSIKDLGVNFIKATIPPNFNENSYKINIKSLSTRYMGKSGILLAPSTIRTYDYTVYNNFQKRIFAYSVIKSVSLMLKIKGKNIKKSSILIYDASSDILKEIAEEAAKQFKYVIFLSKNCKKTLALSDRIGAMLGIIPVVTCDFQFAFSEADAIVLSSYNKLHNIKKDSVVFHVDNTASKIDCININSVAYNNPYCNDLEFTPEVLGALLCQMGVRDIEKSLKENCMYIDKIKFNEVVL